MINVLFLIRSLNPGGAERQIIELVRGIDPSRFIVCVATYYDDGALRPELEAIPGIRVHSLSKTGRWDVLPFLRRLHRLIGAERPQIIYSYLDTANLFGLWAGKRHGLRVIWGVRAAYKDFASTIGPPAPSIA
jgi:hypothetical protein